MSVVEFISELQAKDIKLGLEGGKLKINAPEGILTDEMVSRLKTHKPEIIEFLQSVKLNNQPPLVRVPRQARMPLSFAQQRLWFLDQLSHDARYNMAGSFNISGHLNIDILRKTFETIVCRHELLRTSFMEYHGEPCQVILEPDGWNMPVIDLSHLKVEELHREKEILSQEHASRLFDLTQNPLFRTTVLKLSETKYTLMIAMHHIVSDEWSVGILVHEITKIYDALSKGEPDPLEPLAIQYVDFAQWQKEIFESDDIQKKQLHYWAEQLRNVNILEIPTDFPRQAAQSPEGKSYHFDISEQHKEKLIKRSKELGVTVFSMLLSAYKVLLHRYSGSYDICVGIPFANRAQSELEAIIGFFVNSLPIRSQINAKLEFIDLVNMVQSTVLDVDANQAVPFEKIVAQLSEKRDLSHSPIFQTMFSFQNEQAIETLKLNDLTLEFKAEETNTAKFDFALAIENSSTEMKGIWEYNTNLFEASTAERMAKHFLIILEQVIDNPHKIIEKIDLMNSQEKKLVLEEWNKTETDPAHLSVTQLYIQQAEKMPGKLAIEYQGRGINYGELHIGSNQLANFLRQKNIGRGSRVAVYMERSVEAFTALLAILKAGAAYIPIDSSYPEARVSFILADSKPAYLITQESLLNNINIEDKELSVFCFEKDQALVKNQALKTPAQAYIADDEAYIIYTSGSTGQPKGVRVPHRGLSNLVNWHKQYYGVTHESKASQLAGFSFDACVWEIWPYLASGSSLHIVDDETRLSAKDVIRWIAEHHISHCFLPTLLCEAVLSEPLPKNWALKCLLTGGDRLRNHAPKDASFKLFNNYGPTECSVVTTATEVKAFTDRKLPALGKPINNVKCYVLDKALKPLPVGVVGELYIGGEGLALGYVNRPELTQESFIKTDFEKGLLYKTGDLVRYRSNGDLDYCGRIDQQVQVRGFRVEVGEIEAKLNDLNEINESVVQAQGEGQNKILVAYVVANRHVLKNTELDIEGIKESIKQSLPEYMMPASFVVLERLPVTANGKIDRKKLPLVNLQDQIKTEFVAPSTRTEKIIAGMWRDLLKVTKVGIHDNFFDLGGHSLIATQIVARIRESFHIELPLKLLFEGYDIYELAKKVDETTQAKKSNVVPPITAVKRGAISQVSYAQQRMWILDKLETGNAAYNAGAAYNISAGLFIQGPLKIAALNKAFETLVKRHEILRTTFVSRDGEIFQQVLDPYPWVSTIEDFTELPEAEVDKEIKQIAKREAVRSFDLELGKNARRTRLLRTVLVRVAEEKHYLFTTMHHIISDGWSMNILIKEVEHLYNAYVSNKAPLLEPLTAQYADYAIWQRNILQGDFYNQQLSYWQENLKNLDKTELPIDKPRPVLQSFKGSEYVFDLSPQISLGIENLAKNQGVTVFMTLLAAFKLLLCRYSGQDDICIGTPIANRTHAQQEQLIGFFTNTLALRTDLSGDPGFKELLKRVQTTTMGAYSHQEIPFEKLVDELNVERDLSRTPLFQALFALTNKNMGNINLAGLNVAIFDHERSTSQFDLTLNIEQGEGAIQGRFIFNTDLFELATVAGLAEHYKNILTEVLNHPERKISDIKMLGKQELKQIFSINKTTKKYPLYNNVLEIFEQQVLKTPDNVAVKYEHQQLSYAELNKKANQLAHYLIEQGVKPGQIVAICQERSIELVISMYGIIKAGGAYVPLDPEYPQQRLDYILEDTQSKLLITSAALKSRFGKADLNIIDADQFDDILAAKNSQNTNSQRSAQQLCYVIYTSGSTGQPKGVAIQHAGITNRLQWMQEQYCLDEEDKVLQKTPYSFDVSVWEFLWPLMTGASLVMAKPDGHKDPAYLETVIEQEKITTLHFVPSMLAIFLAQLTPKKCASLKQVICSGEALSKQSEKQFFERLDAKLHNLYGPTEASVDVSYWQCQPNDTKHRSVPIGFPIANIQLYILDKYLNPVPYGVPGELHIAGVGLAQGYLGRPELTAEKFISNPFSNNKASKLYKTGDLAKWLPNGAVEYLGRIDHQVKLRGYRIELGEIESKIHENFAVKDCAVIVREDSPGDQRLVAYIVADNNMPQVETLKKELSKQLPGFMVPSAFIQLDKIPLSSNGKLDRKALPQLDKAMDEGKEFIAPRNDTERTVADIWCEVLKLDVVGVKDNFFELGGHSLLATQIVSRVRDQFHVDIPLSALFESPTIENTALYILEDEMLAADADTLEALLNELDDLDDNSLQNSVGLE